jgi:hypothetical protein
MTTPRERMKDWLEGVVNDPDYSAPRPSDDSEKQWVTDAIILLEEFLEVDNE